MPAKAQQFVFKGMNRDLSPSKADPQFSFENHNIRITSRGDSTLFSITNERGTSQLYYVPNPYNRVSYTNVLYSHTKNITTSTVMFERPVPDHAGLTITITYRDSSNIARFKNFDHVQSGTIITLDGRCDLSDLSVAEDFRRDGKNIFYGNLREKSEVLEGKYCGHGVIGKYLVLFMEHSGKNRIIRLNFGLYHNLEYELLYEGDLNIRQTDPVETLSLYEKEDVQKLYWVDGVNPIRVINVVSNKSYDQNSFDFVRDVQLNDTIEVERIASAGQFSSGIIQYAFSYYNLFGTESNIVNVSPLNYISFSDRGASPEEKISTTFRIRINNPDDSFDYLRLYSIHRTSLDATPTVKVVKDVAIEDRRIVITDNGTGGYTIDPVTLLYIGGEDLIPYTLAQKDNTLFLGNYKLKRSLLGEDLKEAISDSIMSFSYKPGFEVTSNGPGNASESMTLKYNSSDITSFKRGNYYRFGIQLQYKTGKWSEVIYYGDKQASLSPRINESKIHTTRADLSFSENFLSILRQNYPDFKRIRGVIVYPLPSERVVIAQGLVSNTLSTLIDRQDNSPFCQSSWRFINDKTTLSFDKTQQVFRTMIGDNEVQGLYGKNIPEDVRGEGFFNKWVKSYAIAVERRVLTLNSPDIELNDDFINYDLSNAKFRIVGRAYNVLGITDLGTSDKADPSVLASAVTYSASKAAADPAYRNVYTPGYRYSLWRDIVDKGTSDLSTWESFRIPLWTRSGALNNSLTEDNYSKLITHRTSYVEFFNTTTFLNIYPYDTDKVDIQIFSSLSNPLLHLAAPTFRINDDTYTDYDPFNNTKPLYYGNVDRLHIFDDYSLKLKDSRYLSDAYPSLPEKYKFFKDNIRIKYTSSPHAVIMIKDGPLMDVFTAQDCPIGELYRDVDPETIFGGKADSAIQQNVWYIGGEAVSIDTIDYPSPDDPQPIGISYTEGDTYFQRFDSLKVYSDDLNDINAFVSIGSFFCETYINVDGRYDRNKRTGNNLTATPDTFNLLNTAYSQRNNFFTYRAIDKNLFNTSSFLHQVTWGKTKVLGEMVDSWANISLASTMDMDGDKGPIEALRKFNNELYCFQPKGISRIYYNSHAQMIAGGAGEGTIPVELMNSGKVEGKAYITTGNGSSNKWSIISSPRGLYFIDGLNTSCSIFTQEGIVDLSDKLGFRTWVDEIASIYKWNPSFIGNTDNNMPSGIVGFYDPSNSDVYFVSNSNESTVSYSELLGQFVSFYDYDNVPLMVTLEDTFLLLKNSKLWSLGTGTYNNFFGVIKPYSIEFICNKDEPLDKIFNTIEWRATITENLKDSISTFDTIRVTTDSEYQDTKSVKLLNRVNSPYGVTVEPNQVSLRRKFRTWRIPVPRDASAQGKNIDRMRGPWANIKLSKENPAKEKMELHDIVVHFFE